MGKEEFTTIALDLEHETYVVHVGSQISDLIIEKALIKVTNKYIDFVDIFSPDLASELAEHIGINDLAIELVDGQQPPYGPIYSLGPVELETLKAYIETNLTNGFIRPSKSPANIPILFDQKSDSFFRLCVNYLGLNNLTIKNRYPLSLIGKSLDKLGRVRRFIQLDLISTYY